MNDENNADLAVDDDKSAQSDDSTNLEGLSDSPLDSLPASPDLLNSLSHSPSLMDDAPNLQKVSEPQADIDPLAELKSQIAELRTQIGKLAKNITTITDIATKEFEGPEPEIEKVMTIMYYKDKHIKPLAQMFTFEEGVVFTGREISRSAGIVDKGYRLYKRDMIEAAKEDDND